MTCVCGYLALWRLTSVHGVEHGLQSRRSDHAFDWIYEPSTPSRFPVCARAIGPFIVSRDHIVPFIESRTGLIRCYYVWVFGWTMRLPFESNVDARSILDDS